MITNISKSASWGNEKNGEKRYFAVVSFSKGGVNKFASGAIGSNSTYKLSIDLKSVYLQDETCKNDEGEFSPKKAFEKFCDEYTEEGVNLWDIDLKNNYRVVSTGHVMNTARVAIYGTEKEAETLAFNSLARDLKAGRLVKVEEEKEEEDDDE